MRTRSYSELSRVDTFEGRFDYLRLNGTVGEATFGFDRYLNQQFYRSREWKQVRDFVIARDEGCDLGISGYEIHDRILIHHMNPMRSEDLIHSNTDILDPEYLISVSHITHNAVHYGDKNLLKKPLVQRRPGDTQQWKPIRSR